MDVINKIKVCLKATTPLGIQTEDLEEDKLFLGFMRMNEELIDLGGRIQTQKEQQREEEETARREEEEEEEEASPPHGYTAKLRNLGGSRKAMGNNSNSNADQEDASSRDVDTKRATKKEQEKDKGKERGRGNLDSRWSKSWEISGLAHKDIGRTGLLL